MGATTFGLSLSRRIPAPDNARSHTSGNAKSASSMAWVGATTGDVRQPRPHVQRLRPNYQLHHASVRRRPSGFSVDRAWPRLPSARSRYGEDNMVNEPERCRPIPVRGAAAAKAAGGRKRAYGRGSGKGSYASGPAEAKITISGGERAYAPDPGAGSACRHHCCGRRCGRSAQGVHAIVGEERDRRASRATCARRPDARSISTFQPGARARPATRGGGAPLVPVRVPWHLGRPVVAML